MSQPHLAPFDNSAPSSSTSPSFHLEGNQNLPLLILLRKMTRNPVTQISRSLINSVIFCSAGLGIQILSSSVASCNDFSLPAYSWFLTFLAGCWLKGPHCSLSGLLDLESVSCIPGMSFTMHLCPLNFLHISNSSRGFIRTRLIC